MKNDNYNLKILLKLYMKLQKRNNTLLTTKLTTRSGIFETGTQTMEAEAKHTNIEGLPARAEYGKLALQGDQHLMQSPGRQTNQKRELEQIMHDPCAYEHLYLTINNLNLSRLRKQLIRHVCGEDCRYTVARYLYICLRYSRHSIQCTIRHPNLKHTKVIY